MWWHTHFCGRGGATAFAIAAIDIALWDLEGRRRGEPLWRLLGGHRRKVPAYAGGIDLYFTLDALREQTRGFLDRGFGRDQDEGGARAALGGRGAGGGDSRPGRAGLPADGGREHALAGARGDPGSACPRPLFTRVAGRADHSGRRGRSRAGCDGRRRAHRDRREPAQRLRVRADHLPRAGELSGARCGDPRRDSLRGCGWRVWPKPAICP